ncbi:MAG: response regulator [Acaryochloridaceae cyanobacterium RL_2_7]|nr:response regulator [Acaryochloridaceae cyanobacterium RL_2_7]
MKQMVRQLVVAGLVTMEEIEHSFKIYIMNDFDRYLVHPGNGAAVFTEVPEFKEYVPLPGFDLNTILLESIRRRVEWTSFKPLIPSLEAQLTMPSPSASGVTLQETQWQTLKGVIQDGKTLTEVAQSMGKDGLLVAKSFVTLIQQKLIVFDSDDDEPTDVVKSANKSPEVFIVDDSPLLIRQFRTLLEHWGYVVHASEDSMGAVEQIVQIKPDIIFLDINMPVVNGFDLIKQIRRQVELTGVPLVMLTAEKSVSNQWRAQWASCKFLAKPRSTEDVSEFRLELKQLLRDLAPLASDILV